MGRKIIIQKGDPILNKKSHKVTDFDARLHHLLDDMRETLLHAGGLGLAAVQVGILRCAVLVIDENEQMIELINPEILSKQGEQDGFEGCLSLSGLYGAVIRPMTVTVRAQDRNGNVFTITGEGMTARCFCHELEHLDGHLFDEHTDCLYTEKEIDKMSEKVKKK
ncbi:MAG: peptide deformylase [Evtepia sp.]